MKRGFSLLNKKSQMKLSFGMIFSIILIVLFLAFGIYGIMKFLEISECAKLGKMVDSLRDDVDKMWKAPQGSQKVIYNGIPKDVKYICFVNYEADGIGKNIAIFSQMKRSYFGESENLEFYPEESTQCMESIEINHIDIEDITSKENPFCIANNNGKIQMTLKKNFGENLVKIKR